jgi:hypothetical protein
LFRETVPSRTFAPTAKQIKAAREAAHAAGAPLRALLYALIYDTTGREPGPGRDHGTRGKNFAVETIVCRLHEFVNVNELLKQRR